MVARVAVAFALSLLVFLALPLSALPWQGGGAFTPGGEVPPGGGGLDGEVDSGSLAAVVASHSEAAPGSGGSGVEPQPIQFDAWGVTCGDRVGGILCNDVANAGSAHPHLLRRARLNVTIVWDFGSTDATRTYWHGLDNRYDEGFQVGHVFAAGDHTVTAYLLNKEGETLATRVWEFSIATQAAKYPTTTTHCLSADATFDGTCPGGATAANNQSDLDAYLSTPRPDVRIILDDGETFNLSARIDRSAHDGGMIVTNPADPAVIVQTTDGTNMIWASGGETSAADFWRLYAVDWKFNDSFAGSDTNAASRIFLHLEHRSDYIEIIDTRIVGLSGQAGFFMESALNSDYDGDASELPQWTAIVGNDVNCTGDIAFRRNIHFWSSERMLYMDNCVGFTQIAGNVEHLYRSNGQYKVAHRHNRYDGVRPEKNQWTLRDFCDHNAPNNCSNLIATACDANGQAMSYCDDAWGGLAEFAFNAVNYASVGDTGATVSPLDLAGETAGAAGVGFTQGYFLRSNYFFVDLARDATLTLPRVQKIIAFEAGGATGVIGAYDNVLAMGGQAEGYDGLRCGGASYCAAEGNTLIDPADNGAGRVNGFITAGSNSRLIGNVVQKNHSGYTLLLDDGSFGTEAGNVETTGTPSGTSDCGIDFANAHTSLAASDLDDDAPDNNCEGGGQRFAHFLTLRGWRDHQGGNWNAGADPIVEGSAP